MLVLLDQTFELLNMKHKYTYFLTNRLNLCLPLIYQPPLLGDILLFGVVSYSKSFVLRLQQVQTLLYGGQLKSKYLNIVVCLVFVSLH